MLLVIHARKNILYSEIITNEIQTKEIMVNWPLVLRQLHQRTSLSCCPRQRSLKEMRRPQHGNDGVILGAFLEAQHSGTWTTDNFGTNLKCAIQMYRGGVHKVLQRWKTSPVTQESAQYTQTFPSTIDSIFEVGKCFNSVRTPANPIGHLILLCCLIGLFQTLSKLGFKRFQEKEKAQISRFYRSS